VDPRERSDRIWRMIREETREVVWLMSIVGGVSVLAVAIGIVVAITQ
jgi:uncharacterized membrane protein